MARAASRRVDSHTAEEAKHRLAANGGRDVLPMHPICQQTLITNFTNSELQRHGMDVQALLDDPAVRKFVDWVAKKDPDFNAGIAKKPRS